MVFSNEGRHPSATLVTIGLSLASLVDEFGYAYGEHLRDENPSLYGRHDAVL